MMKKIHKQIFSLAAIVLAFSLFNLLIYHTFTYRCVDRYGEAMQAKSITLAEYLPFDEDSGIVRLDSDLKLTGEIPVIDGAAALYPVFSAFVNAVYPEGSVSFDGENFSADSALQMNNTRGSYQAVVDGTVDITICAGPSEGQLAYAEENGVELTFVPIGREAFVFLVNKKNPINGLTSEQIRGIYTGKYTNWSELGGENKPIGALQRNEGSGSQTAMLSFMGDEKIKTDYDSFLGSAIGFSFRFYVEDVVEDGEVKMLALDGVYPNSENIKNETYPIVNNFYAVYRTDNENPNVEILIDWILSEEGQFIIEQTGYAGVAN